MNLPGTCLVLATLVLSNVFFSVDGADVAESNSNNNVVEVKWGIADASASYGRMFTMHIPSDAFSGKVVKYEITKSDGTPMPPWLEFDSQDNVLQGLPLRKDVGQLDLEVTAHGERSKSSVGFTVFVRDNPSLTSGSPLKFKSSSSGPEHVRCKREEPETIATIIIDVDMEQAPVRDQLTLLRRFIKHMGLHPDMLKMVPVGNAPLFDNSALVSGSGDAAAPKTAGSFLSWAVGCGQVKEGHFPILERLDEDSGNSKMAEALGHSILGWRVSNSHLVAPKRKRRQVVATATPVVTPVLPTKTDAASEAMTRKVVETASPTFIKPTATQPTMTKTEDPVVKPGVGTETDDAGYKVKSSQVMEPKVPGTTTKTKPLPTIEPTPTTTQAATDVPDVVGCKTGQKPVVNKPFTKLTFSVGDVIENVIPEDTFEDCEVGGTRGLMLKLFRDVTEVIPTDFFVQFDEKMQKMVGLPTDNDVGRYKMTLVAKKEKLMLASFQFTLVVKAVKSKAMKKINHGISAALDLDYNEFMSNVLQRVDVSNKIASVYGDPNADDLLITSVKAGSVVLSWANKTLTGGNCPVAGISGLVDKFVNKDGTLTQNAIDKMKPYVLLGAASKPAGSCSGNPDFPTIKSKPREFPTTMPPKTNATTPAVMKTTPEIVVGVMEDKTITTATQKTEKPEPEPEPKPTDGVAKGSKGGDGDDDIWISTVVPAVVVVGIILIALIVACVLYRKKRKGKMNVEEQNTFVNNGPPVIFPDELEDKPSDVNKPLLVEGSPAPPGYHRSTGDSPDRETLKNHRNNHHDGGVIEMPERPYDPPPPVTTSSNNKQPRPTQQPMSQPPQILP